MRLEILKSAPSLVDIHVGKFNMKLTGRWFPQIVGNLYPIYI